MSVVLLPLQKNSTNAAVILLLKPLRSKGRSWFSPSAFRTCIGVKNSLVWRLWAILFSEQEENKNYSEDYPLEKTIPEQVKKMIHYWTWQISLWIWDFFADSNAYNQLWYINSLEKNTSNAYLTCNGERKSSILTIKLQVTSGLLTEHIYFFQVLFFKWLCLVATFLVESVQFIKNEI